MTWEETVYYINVQSEYKELVFNSYLETDLKKNVERYRTSDEFLEVLSIIKNQLPDSKKVLDIGSGNGISAIAFALEGFDITAIEPDPGNLVGTGALRSLSDEYKLNNISIIESTGEEFNLEPSIYFDVVFARQTLHHAQNLNRFISNVSKYVKVGSLLISIRDHVINGKKDKGKFLQDHPLHKFYHGENAYTIKEYEKAFINSGFQIRQKLGPFDSVINYYPMTLEEVRNYASDYRIQVKMKLENKFGTLSKLSFLEYFYKLIKGINKDYSPNEKKMPGRLYSFICLKI